LEEKTADLVEPFFPNREGEGGRTVKKGRRIGGGENLKKEGKWKSSFRNFFEKGRAHSTSSNKDYEERGGDERLDRTD